MQGIAAIVTVIFGAVILFELTKNVGTAAKPVTGLGTVTGATSSIVSSLTK